MYRYFSQNKLLHPNMHGYRHSRSTQTALLSIYDKWVRAADKGQVSGVIFLDLSAAFDLVEPGILIDKLRIYGLQDDFLSWVESYLTDRKQSVWIDHTLSNFIDTDVGVPQGSNLGPLFFSVYFNDLLYALDCDTENYADDTTLSSTRVSVRDISSKLNDNCRVVSNWMKSNLLKLNAEKTHLLIVGTGERLQSVTENLDVKIENTNLQEDPRKEETC